MYHKRYIKNLSHCFYECKYHIVWTPKFRGKVFVREQAKERVERLLRSICRWKHLEILELNIQEDHLHICLIIPPKYSISYVVAILKSKTSVWIKKSDHKIKGICDKGSLWARGYYVSTVGINEIIIKRYIQYQSKHHQKDLPTLFDL